MARISLLAGITLLVGALLLIESPLSAADNSTGDWPQWRGPNRDDVSKDTGLLTKWAGAPNLLWEAKGAGMGYASVAVVGGKVFTMGNSLSTAPDNSEYATCFDAETGKQLWMSKLGQPWTSGQKSWQNSRSTPTVDGDLVYFTTPFGQVVCLKTADGKEVWRVDMKKTYGGDKGDGWGYSESVLIDGPNLICTPGKATNTMVALNKLTGEKVWSAAVAGDTGAGHASIVISEIGGTRVYVQTTSAYVLGVRAKDGKVLWTYPMNDPRKVIAVIPTPIVKGDLVLAIAGYGKGAALLRQIPNADGTVKIEEVYGYKAALANKHGGVVLVGDYIYGDSDDRGSIWCAKLTTGELQNGWRARGSGSQSASVTVADGHLYVRYSSGTIALVKADPAAGYKEVGSFKVPHSGDMPSWAHPVVTGGRLYLREGDYILCYDLKAK